MGEVTIQNFTREECVEKLKEIGQTAPGNINEMKMKIRKFCLYPKLYHRLKRKAQRSYQFECSLDPLEVPDITAKWSIDESFYPYVNEKIFTKYCSMKHQGNQGQQEKAFRMLHSRKIVSVKTLDLDEKMKYVKAMIKKSYGTEIRPAVILFKESMPYKAHCSCPVGLSGLCCHVLSLLLFLKHYKENKEKLLQLTCTEQLQK